MPAERVRHFLLEHGIPYETHSHSIAYTARETAQAEHIPDHQMAKSVMMKTDDELVMVVLSGDTQVDLEKARTVLGVTAVRLATEAEFSPLFPDCEKGAEPPFGALYGVATVVDSGLKSPRITFNAGTHSTSISIALSDYYELTKPMVVDIAWHVERNSRRGGELS